MGARILVAQPRGFCAGVVRAIKAAQDTVAEFGPPVYLPHAVVHNELVIQGLERQGIYSVQGVDNVPDGAICIFSAHGSPERDYRVAVEKDLRDIDATCPLETKVHNEARKYSKEGYDIVLIGHEGHPEVRGTMGQVPMTLISENDSPPQLNRPVLSVASREKPSVWAGSLPTAEWSTWIRRPAQRRDRRCRRCRRRRCGRRCGSHAPPLPSLLPRE